MENANDLVNSAKAWLQSLAGSGLKTRLLNPIDEYWDRRIGVRTFGFRPAVGEADAPDYRVCYVPTHYRKLFKIFRRLEIGPEDSFLDIGCGMGRPVFAASWAGAKRAVGIEIDEELVAAARRNLERCRLKKHSIEFFNTPAEAYGPSDATIVYMYHPFGPGTMQLVAEALARDLEARPRRLRIAYENPVHADIIDATKNFRQIDYWPARKFASSPYSVIFWESTT